MDPFANLTEARFRRAFLPSQFENFNPGRPTWAELSSSHPKNSAVALLFIPPSRSADISERGRFARVVLTRRSSVVRTHKSQIGLAGGRMEAGDASPAETVLREIHEEIGINPQDIEIHGTLQSRVSIDGSLVVPVVATANIDEAQFVPAVAEVASIHLCDWVNFKIEAGRRFGFTIFGNRRESWLFNEPNYQSIYRPASELFGAASTVSNSNSPKGAAITASIAPLVWGLTAEIFANAKMR